MKEALRYLNNAKEILRSVPVEDNTYTDVKPVREALGTLLYDVDMVKDALKAAKTFIEKIK